MPVERLRMRPWLENILNTGKYPGVEWLDKEKKIFRLPWKHASRNGWKMQTDACLFRAWAVHTGKYKDTERPNPKIWKANFRCALNSLPDMEEMLDRRSTKGSDAFKVYKIITRLPNSEMRKPLKKYKGRYQRKKRMITRSTSDQKESKPKTANNELMEEEGEVQLESVEVTSHTFSVPQACVRRHLVDHDYAMTRYFDIFDEQNPEAMVRVFNAPDPTIVKTEPPSPNETMPEEYSFYEDENGNVSKNFDSSKEADEKVMSDDEVIELIDELSSECDSSADSVDAAMEEFIEGCMDSIENDFERPSKERSNSAPGLLESSFDSLSVFPTTTLVKSKSVPDVKTMLSTSPQELLQSCLS